MYLKVELKSDLCAASGYGHAGAIDADINYDIKTGLPFIPSKRIKGCLREAGLDILAICPDYENDFYALFGRKGQSKTGALKIHDGKLLYDVDRLNSNEVIDALTTIRTNIRMEKGAGLINKAKEDMLRVARVLNKGEVLYFKIECPIHTDFLGKCCQMLRSIGSNRTRGLGEVECTLMIGEYASDKMIDHKTESNFKIFPYGDKCIAYYQVSLDEPVISTPYSGGGDCDNYLHGSMLLGCFAGLWINSNYEFETQNYHDEPTFRRIFLDNGVIFSNAYPCNLRRKPYYPAPACIKTDKTGESAHDSSISHNEAATRSIGGFIDFTDEYGKNLTPLKINVRREVAQHHARPYDRAAGHARAGGNAADGALYDYVAIAAGQTFAGYIIGSEDDLKLLFKLSKNKILLGRSRSAQYGSATFTWENASHPMAVKPYVLDNTSSNNDNNMNTDDNDSTSVNDVLNKNSGDAISPTAENAFSVPPDGRVRVHVRSPLILYDVNGAVRPDIEILAKRLGMEAERTYISTSLVGGYNSKWRLPIQQMSAIQAGSIAIFKNNSQSKVVLLPDQHIGLRTGMGFGHISIEAMPSKGELEKPIVQEIYQPKNDISYSPSNINSQYKHHSKDLIDRINIQKENQIIKDSANRVLYSKMKNAPSNAQLSRLFNALNRKDNPINTLESLKHELRDKNPAWKDEDKRKKMQDFTDISKPPSDDWMLYKIWLTTLIHLVKLERMKSNA